MNPTVTVVIPTYNRPTLVSNAIQSVLDQSLQDFEIIVVDDGQKQRAKDVVDVFGDQRIRYIQHTARKGCSGAKNTGVREAKGMYVAFLDDDDMFMPTKLELQVEALEKAGQDVGFSFTGSLEMYDDREYKKTVPDGVADYHELALRNFSLMIDSSMLYRHEVFKKAGLLDETFPTHTGAEFMIRVSGMYKGVGINVPLVKRLIKSDHVQMGSNIENRIKGRKMLLSRYKKEFQKHPSFLAKHTERLAKFHRAHNDFESAAQDFLCAFKIQPRAIRFLYYISMLSNGFLYKLFSKLKN